MSLRIGGPLGVEAMALLAGGDAPQKAFRLMTRAGQADAVKRMARDGRSDHEIASATGLSVVFVRQVISNRDASSC